jgi:hypothetical protein
MCSGASYGNPVYIAYITYKAMLVGWWAFVVKECWTVQDNIYECVRALLLATVAMKMLLRDFGSCSMYLYVSWL